MCIRYGPGEVSLSTRRRRKLRPLGIREGVSLKKAPRFRALFESCSVMAAVVHAFRGGASPSRHWSVAAFDSDLLSTGITKNMLSLMFRERHVHG